VSPRRGAETTVEKAPTGIAGLDESMGGGLPRGRTTLVFGGPGSGKTVLALQTLAHGASRWDEPGIFVAFEESAHQILANAASFGWDLPELQRRKLFILDATLRPDTVHAGKFDLSGVLAALAVKVKELGAARIVFDGIDVLLTLLDDPTSERAELFRIQEWVQRHKLTGVLTAKADGAEPFSQARYGFAAYMADCALLLARQHQDVVSERSLTILKYRGSAFSENKSPYVIGPSGIEVAEQNASAGAYHPTTERLSTGVPRFDTMLNGGYLRAASVLITGLPGTAKSTLSGAFVSAACRRGERALYVTFDERAEEVVRNLASAGIRLQPFVDSGRLAMMSALALRDSAEVQLMRIRSGVRRQRASCVVIDPISALAKSSDASVAVGVLARFIHWVKVNGITLVCPSLLSGSDPHLEATDLGVSTLCDTWVHLAYAQRGGERNRALTVIKSRGTGHSNQVRELIVSDDGLTLADVYQSGGEVFMGTMRWEHENAQRDAERRTRIEAKKRQLELKRSHAELQARKDAVERDLALLQIELEDSKRSEAERREREMRRHADLLSQRRADATGVGATARSLRATAPAKRHSNKGEA
jgi:circadian clock protein KaiC